MFGLSLKQKEQEYWKKCLLSYEHLYSYTYDIRHPTELCVCTRTVHRNQVRYRWGMHSYTNETAMYSASEVNYLIFWGHAG